MLKINRGIVKLTDQQRDRLCSVRKTPRLTRKLACFQAVSQPINHVTPPPRAQHDTTSPRDPPTASELRIFGYRHNS